MSSEVDREREMAAIAMRAAEQESKRQAAASRGDRQTAAAATEELSRLWGRYCDLKRSAA